ncbi:hypothetical protein FB45DRAFT_1112855 [Roridomyces roridus]|uniref:F-box domain-containing protein n=1 Tax=Roridomyces roridus TaxID=1738132 RepID=A0AAD7B7T6_9AGAR|nr:hypothetical protein FB45DRAFT_1112855 [Roridomyces roridus]
MSRKLDRIGRFWCYSTRLNLDYLPDLSNFWWPGGQSQIISLPNEITAEIFIHYVDDSRTRSPMRLTWTCKLWREVAISTCGLWTCFRSHSASLLPSWLPRAGHLNLDLDITYDSTLEAQAVTQLLRRHSNQVRTLDVCLGLSRRVHDSVELDGPFPCLERLGVFDPKSVSTPPSPLYAPRLREVTFGELSLTRWRKSLPWTQITKLYLGTDKISPSTRQGRSGLRFHHLSPFATCASSLSNLIVPALERLTIVLASEPTDDSRIVSALIERSGCTLRSLELDLWFARKQSLDSFLEDVPLQSLRELTLRDPYGKDDAIEELLDYLTLRGLPNPPLPLLESFGIQGCQFHVHLPPVVDMLRSRMKEGAKLKKFQLSFGPSPDSEPRTDAEIFYQQEDCGIDAALDKLSDLRARGLEVDICSTVKWSTGSVIEALRGGDCLF